MSSQLSNDIPSKRVSLPKLFVAIVIAISLTAAGFTWYYISRWAAASRADKISSQYMKDFSIYECHDRANTEVFRSIYRNIQVNNALSDPDMYKALSLCVGPKKEANAMRTFITGMLLDASHSNKSCITHRQMVIIALTCKPLLTESAGALRESECSFLYRSKLPEAADDILPLTQDPSPLVRQHALTLLKKIGRRSKADKNAS